MKKIRYTKLIIWLVTFTLLGSISLQAKVVKRSDVNFRDMQYERVESKDVDYLLELGTQVLGTEDKELIDKWENAYLTLFFKLTDNSQLAHLFYELDHTDTYFYNEYLYCINLVGKMKSQYLALTQKDDESKEMQAYYELSAQRQQLIEQYNSFYYGTRIEYQGKQVNLTDILKSESMTIDKKKEIVYGPWYDLYNKQCAEVFLKLVKLDIESAKLAGASSVAEYKYKAYSRDYTPDEAKVFYEAVKKYAPKIYKGLKIENDKARVSLAKYSFEDDSKMMEKVGQVFMKEYPALKESYDYLMKYDLYDIIASSNKAQGGFTTFLTGYNEPFISLNYQTDYQTLSSLIHEFGHFNYEYYIGGVCNSLDLGETYSQGLELLAFPYHKKILGSIEQSKQIQEVIMCDMVRGIIDGCVFDEFLQRVYTSPDMTVEQLNALYGEIAEAYGLEVDNRDWVEVEHNFASPFYYISYAMSAISSLEIWQQAQTNEKAAMDTYIKLIDSGSKYQFQEALKSVGMQSPFDEKVVKEVMDTIGRYFAIDGTYEAKKVA